MTSIWLRVHRNGVESVARLQVVGVEDAEGNRRKVLTGPETIGSKESIALALHELRSLGKEAA